MPFVLPAALFFTGIDWAAETHAVCVMDAGGKIAAEFVIEHSADGIGTLIRRLARFGEAGDVPVAIERPDGRLVDLLLEAGHPVVPVKPNAIKTWRDGEVLSGAKSDAGDAAVIAEYLRLRAHKLRDLEADHVIHALTVMGETRASRTVRDTRAALVRAITYAQARNLVGRNVASLIKAPPGKAPGKPSRALTAAQDMAVLAAAAKDRLHAYFVLSLLIGVRTEEARALRWDHVDLDGDLAARSAVPIS